jgi:phage baseplate assembly protein W
MADIDFDTLINSNIITDLMSVDFTLAANTLSNTEAVSNVSSIDFTISADTFTSSNSIPNVEITLVVLADTFANTNTVSNVSSVDFTILPNTLSNINTIRNVIVYEPPIVLLLDSQSNTNIVSNIDNIVFTDVLAVSTIVNSNSISNVFIGDDREIIIGTVNNAITNIVSQCSISLQDVTVLGTYNNRPFVNLPRLNDFSFCDISMDFIPHPLTGDIANLYDSSAINQSLNNLLLMGKHENAFEDYRVGSRVKGLLFELYDSGLDIEIQQEIFATLVDYEPRIYIDDIKVKGISDKHSIEISIFYHIKSFNKIQQYNITLDRA